MKQKINEFLIPIRHYLHQNPELGYNTQNTAKYIKNILDNLGYETCLETNNASVIAKLDLGKEKTIAFRSDIDALQINEDTDLEYKSTNGCMHACGHDAHMSILLSSAKLFIEKKEKLNANIVLIFQCAEEGPLPGGAIKLIDHAYLKGVDAFFAYHVTNKYPSKHIAIKYGEACAAPDLWELEITGKGCHAASPSLGVNPILAGSEIVGEYKKLYDYLLKENKKVVITTTYFHSGVSMNIIPESLSIKGTARSFNDETRKYLHTSLDKIANEVALKYNAKAKFTFHYAYDPVINDNNLSDFAKECANAIIPDSFIELNDYELIGDDFSYFRRLSNICYMWLGVRGEKQDFYDLHNPKFILDEENLYYAVLVNLEIALNYK